MKYIKTFEISYVDLKKIAKYKINDIVLYDNSKVMRITDIEGVNFHLDTKYQRIQYEGFNVSERLTKYNDEEFIYIIEDRINRKLNEDEIEFHINLNKYNL